MEQEIQIFNSPIMNDDYYKVPRMSNSAMTHFKRSPRHYLYYKSFKVEPTPAMVFGQAFHCFVLEPDKFYLRFCCVPKGAPKRPSAAQWNAKKPSPDSVSAMEWWTKFNKEHGDKVEIDSDELETIKRMNDALYANEFVKELMEAVSETEKPLLWKDDITGIEMKGKLDCFSKDFTLDIKTCINATPEYFSAIAFDSGYHRQGALYMDGRALNEEKKHNKGDFYFIAIEKEPPYGISPMKCAKDFIEHGRMVYGSVLEDYRYWIEMGSPDVDYEWRSPFGYHDLNLPRWVR